MSEAAVDIDPRMIMIVEDDVDVRESIAEVLADNCYESVSASNGQDAMDKLRARKRKPFVILLDIMMPIMD